MRQKLDSFNGNFINVNVERIRTNLNNLNMVRLQEGQMTPNKVVGSDKEHRSIHLISVVEDSNEFSINQIFCSQSGCILIRLITMPYNVAYQMNVFSDFWL
jgi:hypothetical protein